MRMVCPLRRAVAPLHVAVQAFRLAETSAEIAHSLSLFRIFYFTRRSYVPRAISMLREALGGDRLEQHVDSMLGELRSDLSMKFSVLTALLLVVLSVVGVALTYAILVSHPPPVVIWHYFK